MNDNKIYGLPQPTGSQQPTTKKYVDDKNALQDTAINDKAEKSDVSLLDGSQAMTGNLQMGSKKITHLADPVQDNEAVNKGYLDRKEAHVDLTDYLKRDGSQSMTGNLQMGDYTITGIRSSSQDNAALTVGGAKSLYLPLSGNKRMEGALNMGKNTIRYLEMPSNDPSSGNPPDD